jgi:hypothetical protein
VGKRSYTVPDNGGIMRALINRARNICLALLFLAATTQAQTLTLHLLDGKSTAINLAEIKTRIHVNATDHDGKAHDYEGVDLRALLTQFGVPAGHDIHGKELTDYIVAEASDGYRVVFALAELESDFADTQILIADRMDGQPLNAHDGPLRLVVPRDKRPARWIRMLTGLTVQRAP